VALPEFNGWCQYVTCPASVCFKLPADMTYHEAVALASNGLTAYSLLFELGAHHSGKSVLYHPVPGALVTTTTHCNIHDL
jgi:NADPH:quinone reductase-like Zn-dependent oxidoreductase